LDYNKINYKNRTIKPVRKLARRRRRGRKEEKKREGGMEASIPHFMRKMNYALSLLLIEEREERD
jgi:hypothetical protein